MCEVVNLGAVRTRVQTSCSFIFSRMLAGEVVNKITVIPYNITQPFPLVDGLSRAHPVRGGVKLCYSGGAD